jgi:hypothetical protein
MSDFMVREGQLPWSEKPDSPLSNSLFSAADISDVSDITHAPEILGGRVKTLHPSVHGGICPDED